MNLKQQLNNIIESGVSQSTAAKAMGISGSVLSDWRNDKYKGDNSRIETLVTEFVNRQSAIAIEKETFKMDFDFVETSIFNDIATGAQLAEIRGEIRTVCGDSGVGKTTSLIELQRRKPSSVFIQVYRGIRKNRFLKKICKALGIDERGSFDDLFERITDHLHQTKRLIMIDEAEHLPLDAIDALRRFVDFTGCGLLLVGLPIFYRRLQEYQREYAYIYNRTSIPIMLKHLTESDTNKMITTMFDSALPTKVWFDASNGIGRDLKIIALESLRVAQLNGLDTYDVKTMTEIINQVKKSLGRFVAA